MQNALDKSDSHQFLKAFGTEPAPTSKPTFAPTIKIPVPNDCIAVISLDRKSAIVSWSRIENYPSVSDGIISDYKLHWKHGPVPNDYENAFYLNTTTRNIVRTVNFGGNYTWVGCSRWQCYFRVYSVIKRGDDVFRSSSADCDVSKPPTISPTSNPTKQPTYLVPNVASCSTSLTPDNMNMTVTWPVVRNYQGPTNSDPVITQYLVSCFKQSQECL